MNYPIKLSEITSDLEYYNEVIESSMRAKKYLLQHRWCKTIKEGWLFTNLGYPLCIFLFEVENLQSPEDNFLWVMSGDFPSIYLDTYKVKTTKEVIRIYIELAKNWIESVEKNRPLDDCYPFEASSNKETADLFNRKVSFLKENIIDHIKDLSSRNLP
jgi:hypothetical protein